MEITRPTPPEERAPDLQAKLFVDFQVKRTSIPVEAKIVFVADLFSDEYLGGAELTLDALIATAPVPTHRIRARDLSIDDLAAGPDRYWVFGNYTTIDPSLIPAVVERLRYSIVECDYKFCRYRSPEKHAAETGTPCDCAGSQRASLVTGFLSAADHVWWMSEAQRDEHVSRFPFLRNCAQDVLSSVFDDRFFVAIARLRMEAAGRPREKWLVLDSPSWIKGTAKSKSAAEEAGFDFELVRNVSYDEMLRKLSLAKGLIYLPPGKDTCPRLVIEAKLLGCELVLNDNIQHRHEAWFDTDDVQAIEDYLRAGPGVFWRETLRHLDRRDTLSGDATTYKCVHRKHAFRGRGGGAPCV